MCIRDSVNTDEILREFGDWRNTSDLMKAGRIAVERLNSYLSEGITFNQETTLCGHSILRTIYRAKQLGYVIELHYVCVDSVSYTHLHETGYQAFGDIDPQSDAP